MTYKKDMMMMAAVGEASKYQKENPSFGHEEVLRFIMKRLKLKSEDKILAIAAVSKALDYKERKPHASDKEIMQYLMKEISNIGIEEELFNNSFNSSNSA